MKRKMWILMLLAFASLALSGDSCFLKNTDIEVPFRANVDMQFTSTGFTDADVETVDFGDELMDLEDDATADIDSLVSGDIEGAFWRRVENRVPGTVVTGSIEVTRVSTSTTAMLVDSTSVNVDATPTTFEAAPLEPAGVALLNQGIDDYIAYRNGESGFPDLRFVFTWNSSSSTAADFDWEARIRFVLVGVFAVEVPDLWD